MVGPNPRPILRTPYGQRPGNEFGRTPGDDLHAKQSVRLLMSHDFHQAVGCPGSQSPAIGSQRKSARAGGTLSLLGLPFAQSAFAISGRRK